MSTPYKKKAPDSPSRQLLWELNQLAISSQEGFYAHLDRENEEREDLHKQALATAAQRHERVRKNAENEKRRLEEEQEAKLVQFEEEQRKTLEDQRRENALAVQRRKEERDRAEAQHQRELAQARKSRAETEERIKAETERQNAEAASKLQEKQDAEKRKKEEAKAAEVKAKESAVAAIKARAQPTAPISTPAPRPATHPTRNPQWELDHDRYLQIHRELKNLRKFMSKAATERQDVKTEMGNMRRDIKKSVGQLTGDKGANRQPLATIINILKKALTFPEPKINVTLFLAHKPATTPADPNGPALMIYLLNIFAKAIIAQFIDEAGVKPEAADPIGVIGSHIFALEFFRWQGISLIDILLAKMHVVAPAIFGIYGPEDTAQGRERLGWWRGEGRSEGPFLPQQDHFTRMTGLGSGFAALSLRNYEKAKVENPFPESNYWTALAKLTSAPPAAMTQTQFVLLKALIEGYETKFIAFYGGQAVAALREILIELPGRCPPSVASKSLAGLKVVLEREKKLFL